MINLIGKKAQIACELLCCCSMAYAQSNDNSEVVVLNTGWEFSQAGTELWRPAQVPGTVHQDLIYHKQIPDPFYGINEQKIQWVENEDWEYRTAFTVTPEQLKRDDAQLVFEGLDTYADVYLNGALLLKADNMFVGYTIPVKSQLRIGENLLHIYFHSPIRQTMPQYNSNGFNYPADNDHHEKHVSVFSRKAPYSYGWDWGIRMVTSGIWRPVTIRYYDAASISDYHVKQLSLTDQLAKLSNELEINNILPQALQAEVRINTSFEGNTEKGISQAITLQPGINHISIPSEVLSPVRWMPNGWGKPALYDFSAQIIVEDKVVAQQSHRIGLRTVRLVNEKDQDGESFYFEVNGVPMFAKGANYIPQDALLTNVTTERYQTLFRDIKEANMNVIRVWGGGTYEDDRFYDLADENGILIWQDFMFACSVYELTPEFEANIRQEFIDNIKRLRHHASLALWCGNNEMEMFVKQGTWVTKPTEMRDYLFMYERIIPEVLSEYDPDTFYWPASPSSGGSFDEPNDPNRGDVHYWEVWHGNKPFSEYRKYFFRYASEFGFQSFPSVKTLETVTDDPKELNPFSYVMEKHQRNYGGNGKIAKYMQAAYRYPENFSDFVYASQLLQADGIRYGVEHYRRNRGRCMGAIYWQLNDCWPVISWSSIDYYGRWKALHYYAKRFFAPVMLSCEEQSWMTVEADMNRQHFEFEKSIRLNVTNETLDAHRVLVKWAVRKTDATILREEEQWLEVPALSAVWMDKVELPQIDCFNEYVSYEAWENDQIISQGTVIFSYPKYFRYLNPGLTVRVDGDEIVVKAEAYAKSVEIRNENDDLILEDNYFDMNAGEYRVKILDGKPDGLKVRSVYDI